MRFLRFPAFLACYSGLLFGLAFWPAIRACYSDLLFGLAFWPAFRPAIRACYSGLLFGQRFGPAIRAAIRPAFRPLGYILVQFAKCNPKTGRFWITDFKINSVCPRLGTHVPTAGKIYNFLYIYGFQQRIYPKIGAILIIFSIPKHIGILVSTSDVSILTRFGFTNTEMVMVTLSTV